MLLAGHHTIPFDGVPHALVRAVSRLFSTRSGLGIILGTSIETSLDAARKSACATWDAVRLRLTVMV